MKGKKYIMTRQDYFAGLAMQEILKSKLSKEMNLTEDAFKTHIVKQSYSLANEMIKHDCEIIDILKNLVSDVGNLISEYDIEWQQAGYFEEAKRLLKQYS